MKWNNLKSQQHCEIPYFVNKSAHLYRIWNIWEVPMYRIWQNNTAQGEWVPEHRLHAPTYMIWHSTGWVRARNIDFMLPHVWFALGYNSSQICRTNRIYNKLYCNFTSNSCHYLCNIMAISIKGKTETSW